MSDCRINIALVEEEERREKIKVGQQFSEELLARWMSMLTTANIRETIKKHLSADSAFSGSVDRYKIVLIDETHYRTPGFDALDMDVLFETVVPPHQQSLRQVIESRVDMTGAELYALRTPTGIKVVLDYRHPWIRKTDVFPEDESCPYEPKIGCSACILTCMCCLCWSTLM